MTFQLPLAHRLLALGMSLLVLAGVVCFVRRRLLLEQFAWLWLSLCAALLGLAVYPRALFDLAGLLRIPTPASALFFFAIFGLVGLCLYLSMHVSRLTLAVKNLVQELALLKEERERRGPKP